MAILEAVLTTSFYSQQCVNRFNYVSTGTPSASSLSFLLVKGLGGVYENSFVPPSYPSGTLTDAIRLLLASSVQFLSWSVRDVYSEVDFFENPFIPAMVGAINQEALSPTMAYGFTSTRTRSDVRRGQKRFVGVVESATGGGGVLTSDIAPNMAAVVTQLQRVITVDDNGNAVSFAPAIAGKEKYVVPGSPAGEPHYAYRYYPTESAQMAKTMTGIGWAYKQTVRTQTSRQYGRGI